MRSQTFTATPTLTIPLSSVASLYQVPRTKRMVFEVDIAALKRSNKPNAIDRMVAEARQEYALGKTKGFRSTKALMAYLNR